MSQRPTKKADPALSYQNFKDDCPRYLTYISDRTYRQSCSKLTPWANMEGWSLRSVFFDFMHTVYLGIGKDLISNLLGDFVDSGVLGPGELDEQLRRFSLRMHEKFKSEKKLRSIKGSCFVFTKGTAFSALGKIAV